MPVANIVRLLINGRMMGTSWRKSFPKTVNIYMKGSVMIGTKNSNSIFRFSVAVIMLLTTLGLISIRAQTYDIVASYSETFYNFYGFSPYQYYFSDSDARRLTINFYGKNCLIIENNSQVFGMNNERNKDMFPFCDTIYFHVIDFPIKEWSVHHKQIIVDSVLRQGILLSLNQFRHIEI